MKNWNTTGKIKASLLALFSIPNMIEPLEGNLEPGLFTTALIVLIFGSLAVPLLTKLNTLFFNQEIIKPQWNDNPMTTKQPLSFLHFAAFFFLTIGASMVIGSAITSQTINQIGLFVICFGIGILIGIRLTLKWLGK